MMGDPDLMPERRRSPVQAGRSPHVPRPQSRRDFLLNGGAGFGALALADLLGREATAAAPGAPPAPAFPGPAKRVISLFREGGPSHIDLFDPKPLLNKLAGSPLPESFGTVITAMGEAR